MEGVAVAAVVRLGCVQGLLFADELPETLDSLGRRSARDRRALAPVTAKLVTAAEIYVWNSREAWVAPVYTKCCDINPQRYWTCSGRDARL